MRANQSTSPLPVFSFWESSRILVPVEFTTRQSSRHDALLVLESGIQSLVYVRSQRSRKINRHGIANLPHAFSPRTWENIFIRKSLQSGAFTNSEVPYGAIRIREHVFATGDA